MGHLCSLLPRSLFRAQSCHLCPTPTPQIEVPNQVPPVKGPIPVYFPGTLLSSVCSRRPRSDASDPILQRGGQALERAINDAHSQPSKPPNGFDCCFVGLFFFLFFLRTSEVFSLPIGRSCPLTPPWPCSLIGPFWMCPSLFPRVWPPAPNRVLTPGSSLPPPSPPLCSEWYRPGSAPPRPRPLPLGPPDGAGHAGDGQRAVVAPSCRA